MDAPLCQTQHYVLMVGAATKKNNAGLIYQIIRTKARRLIRQATDMIQNSFASVRWKKYAMVRLVQLQNDMSHRVKSDGQDEHCPLIFRKWYPFCKGENKSN
jgi:hypothetical protein